MRDRIEQRGWFVQRVREDAGFTMVLVMGLLLLSSLFALAAWAAASSDIPAAQHDVDAKRAFSAAEAGIDYYLFHLNQDNSYWSNCTNVPAPGPGQPSPINQVWNGQGPDPRAWRALPNSKAKYTIELLPQNGYAQCSLAQPALSMIDATSETLQVRATGISNGVKRSIVATVRPAGFLDYLYFTDYETLDPAVYQLTDPGRAAWAAQNCATYRRNGRPSDCTAIVFANQDVVAGPLHTNDDLLLCGSPTFGRRSTDNVEVSSPPPGWAQSYGCGGSPNMLGTFKTTSPVLTMPSTNASLSAVAQPGYTFTGTTTIVLNGTTMTVTNSAANLTNATMPLPANGVIYVQNGACGTTYNFQQQYNDPAGCANVYVKGTYSRSLTLASQGDVVVTGSLLRNGNTTLGLIPNNFARVYHPVSFDGGDGGGCSNASSGPYGPAPGSLEIDAAILSLQHSFIVDNYYCGSPLGTLTVNGAIAQRFRGPVGTGGSSQVNSGYVKNYNYDDRLKLISPPYFLNPIQSQWVVARFTEQSPAI
jgi:Tfp pilus assembly protein PilX